MTGSPPGPPTDSPPASPGIVATLKRLGPAGVVAAIASVLPSATGTLLLIYIQPMGQWLKSHGNIGVLVAMASFTIFAGLIPSPTQSYALLCGWAFGARVGAFAAVLAIVAAGMINYAWARLVCRDRATTLLEENPKSRAVYNSLLRSSPLKTFLVVILIRIAIPFALANVLLAATRVRFMTVLAGTVVGVLPRTLVCVIAAAGMSRLDPKFKENMWFWIGTIVVILIFVAILGWIAQRALERATAGGEIVTKPEPATPPSL